MQPLYNHEGRAVAYIADNESSVYLYDGGPAGWIHQGCVYAYSGRFLGWMIYGWLCDPQGHPAFFTDRSQGGPKRPAKQARPLRGSREFRPQRATRWGRPSRPGMKLTWSKRSDESFFAAVPGEQAPAGAIDDDSLESAAAEDAPAAAKTDEEETSAPSADSPPPDVDEPERSAPGSVEATAAKPDGKQEE